MTCRQPYLTPNRFLLFGPGEVKGELDKRLEKDQLGARIKAVETENAMKDHRIAAKSESIFTGREAEKMNIKLVLGLILAGLAVLFIIQNVAVAEIRFLFWTIAMSRSLLMFFILAIGIVLGWLLHSFIMNRQEEEMKNLES